MGDGDAFDAELLDWGAAADDLATFTPDTSGSMSFRFDGIVRENQDWPEGAEPRPDGTPGEPSVYIVWSLEPAGPVAAGRALWAEGQAHAMEGVPVAWNVLRVGGFVQKGADVGALLLLFAQLRAHLATTAGRLAYFSDLARSYAVGVVGEYHVRELRVPCVRA